MNSRVSFPPKLIYNTRMTTRSKRGREESSFSSTPSKTTKNILALNGLEENTMAMLDYSNFRKSATNCQDYMDDRLTFLEAVRSASIIVENGVPPTKKMYEAVLKILKKENSLELIMSSYQLLIDLEKCFPRACFPESGNSLHEVGVDEAWSPFYFGHLDVEASTSSSGSIDPLAFHSLIEEVSKVSSCNKAGVVKLQSLRATLLMRYLLVVIEADFLPRTRLFSENINWALMRDSMLNLLMCSRKIIHKALVKDCLQILSKMSEKETVIDKDVAANQSSTHLLEGYDPAFSLAFPEVQKSTRASLSKLLFMMMELDSFRCVADQHGRTSRADGVRAPAADIILDELIYNVDLLNPFLQVLNNDNMMLKLIIQYFQKYIPQSSGRTRRPNSSVDNTTFDVILKCLSNNTNAKNIIKKVGTDVVQLLLTHALKAYLSLSLDQPAEGLPDAQVYVKDTSLVEVCKYTISAITCIREVDKDAELVRASEEALFTAATIISINQ